jgi:cell division protein FtsW (lipid II flippase)
MNLTSIILVLAVLGVVLGLLMKFNKTFQDALRLNAPDVNKKYINYKINFLIVIGVVLIIVQTISMAYPNLSDKLDMIVSAFLLVAIILDVIVKRKMKKNSR